MLTPPVWRARERQSAILGTFTVALMAGALTTSTTLYVFSGLLDPVPDAVRAGLTLMTVFLLWLREAGILSLRLPQRARQIPPDVFQNPPHIAAARFGFELGTGFRTYVPSNSAYAMAAGVLLLAPSWTFALLAGAGFGLGRGAMPALRALSHDGEEWDSRMRQRLKLIEPASLAIATMALVWVI